MVKGSSRIKILRLFQIWPGFQRWVFLLAVFSTISTGSTSITFAGLPEIDKQYQQARTLREFEKIAEKIQKILEKEREIYSHQAKESGKPENIIEKIVSGKMEKFYEENCVLEQAFVKDTNITIGDLIKQKIALLGENINLGKFSRFEI